MKKSRIQIEVGEEKNIQLLEIIMTAFVVIIILALMAKILFF